MSDSPSDEDLPEDGSGVETDTESRNIARLTEEAVRTAGIQVAPAETRAIAEGAVADVIPGQVEFDPARMALISPRSSGRIERLTVVEGESVQGGQPVAYLLSTEFLTAQQDLIQAARGARRLQGTSDQEGADALVEAARRRLRLLGAGSSLIDRIVEDGERLDFLPVTAPFAGRIVEAHVLAGAGVEPGDPIFTLADLSVVFVAAEVPERLLRHLRVGQEVAVGFSAYPNRQARGRVARIKDELDRDTRTATALIQVENAGRDLRPGMFASVRLGAVTEAVSEPVVVVPEPAVILDGPDRYVFVEIGQRAYERRMVEVEPLAGDDDVQVVRSGLEAGEPVVVRGAFALKSDLEKDAFGDDD